jgi:PAS domain S-box-containing protein
MAKFSVGRLVFRHPLGSVQRILVVRNGSASVESLHHSIELAGYKAESVSGSTEALKTLSRNLFDVIFVDHSVPDLELNALCKRARKRNPNVFIVLTSEHLDFPFLQDALTAGANDVLALPTDEREVRSLVKKAASEGETADERITRTGLAALQEFNLRINSCQTLDEMLRFVLEKSLAALDAVSGSIFLYDEDRRELILKVADGPLAESILGTRQGIGSGIAGLVAQSRQALSVTDIGSDPRFEAKESERYKTGSFLCVPLVSAHQLVGVISASDKKERTPFTKTDIELLSVLATNAAVVTARFLAHQAELETNEQLREKIGRLSAEFQETVEEITYLRDHNRNIIDSISLGVAVFGYDLRVNFCNQAFGEIFGRDAGDFLRMNVLELSFDIERKRLERALLDTLREGTTHRFEPVRWYNPASEKTLKLDVAPFSASSGNIVGGVLVVEDITAHVALERELARSEEQAAVGRIAAGVAHELNNPLDGVLRFVNLSLAQEDLGSPIGEYLKDARDGLNRMAGIIKALLSFSRKSTGADNRPVNVNEVVQEVVAAMAPTAASQGVEVTFDLCENGLTVRGGQLHQVCANLIKNAYDAMPGGGKLAITTRMDDDTVRIVFTDHGHGIPSDMMDKIFEPFVTTKEIGKGVGLGLSICKRIIERYGGGIRVKSTVGEGTTFTVELPSNSDLMSE